MNNAMKLLCALPPKGKYIAESDFRADNDMTVGDVLRAIDFLSTEHGIRVRRKMIAVDARKRGIMHLSIDPLDYEMAAGMAERAWLEECAKGVMAS